MLFGCPKSTNAMNLILLQFCFSFGGFWVGFFVCVWRFGGFFVSMWLFGFGGCDGFFPVNAKFLWNHSLLYRFPLAFQIHGSLYFAAVCFSHWVRLDPFVDNILLQYSYILKGQVSILCSYVPLKYESQMVNWRTFPLTTLVTFTLSFFHSHLNSFINLFHVYSYYMFYFIISTKNETHRELL